MRADVHVRRRIGLTVATVAFCVLAACGGEESTPGPGLTNSVAVDQLQREPDVAIDSRQDASPSYGSQSIELLFDRMAADIVDGLPVVVTTIVVLCDNTDVACGSGALGDGWSPSGNLYWGARYGLRTMFQEADSRWAQVYARSYSQVGQEVAEVRIFSREVPPSPAWQRRGVTSSIRLFLVAKAYRGGAHLQALDEYFDAVAGKESESWVLDSGVRIDGGGASHLVGYVGHNYLMDPRVRLRTRGVNSEPGHPMGTFALACESEPYFAPLLDRQNIKRIVMTNEFMAPEAYSILALLDALGAGSEIGIMRESVVLAYATYQKNNYPHPLASAKAIFLPRR